MPSVTATTMIPYEDWIAIDEAVKKGQYESKSDFIRQAVRKLLEETKR